MENKFSIQLSADDSKLISALNNSKQKLQHLETAFEKAGSKSKVFGSATESLGSQLQGLSGQFEGLLSKVGGSMEGLSGMFGGGVSEMLGSLGSLGGGFAALGAAAVGAVSYILKGFDELKSEMNNFQAVTDVSDEEMKEFEKSARDLSNSTGVAEKSIIALQTSLVGITPSLAQNREALLKSTEAAILLGKAGRISAEEASTALSSILAQYNLAGTESLNVANAIAAGSKAGAIEIEGLGIVLQRAGTTLSSAGLNYAQSVALVESVGDKWIGKESELSTHLQSTFSKLQSVRKEWEMFNPAIVGTTQALENMNNAHLKYSDLVELVGLQNAPLLQQLIDSKNKYQALAQEISSATNTVQEMSAKQTETISNSWQRVTVTWENLMTSIANSQAFQELYSYIQYVCDAISDLISFSGELIDEWNNLMGGFEGSFTIWDYMKAHLQTTIALIKWISEVVVVSCSVIIKNYQNIWNGLIDFANWLQSTFSETPIGRAFMASAKMAWEWIKKLFDGIKKAWDDLKKYLGLKNGGSTDVKVDVKENKTITETYKGGGSGLPSISKKGGGKKGGSKKGGSKKTEIAPPEIGSLKFYEDKLRAVNDELSRTTPNAGRLQELKMEAHVLEEQIAKIKKRNALHDKVNVTKEKPIVEKGSIQEISDLISSKESQIKNLRVGSDSFNLLRDEIEKLKADKELLELSLHPKVDENSMNSLLGSLQKVQEQINGLKTSISVTTDKTELDLLSEQLKFLTDKEHKIQLSIDEKRQENAKNAIEETRQEFENLGDITNNVGSIFSNLGRVTNDTFLSMVGAVSSGISQMLPQIRTLIEAQKAQALGGIISSNANLGLLSFGLIASGVALVTSLFDSLPKFERGGIVGSVVGGNSFHGDKILARLNSGELVLNKNQQTRLYNTLQQGHTSSAPMGGAVQFKISGRDLVGVLSTHQKITSRVL